MQETEFQLAGAQGTELPARLWLPDGQPRLVLQISHGMTEHSGRYDTLAAALAEHGIACAAFDLRGHGRNPGSRTWADMGPDGWEQSLSDLQRFCERLRENFPGVPLGMLGFSLGSFLLRDALCRGMAAPAGVILAGTGTQPGARHDIFHEEAGGAAAQARSRILRFCETILAESEKPRNQSPAEK